jgi:ketosteroid isomerase-like protein
MKPARLFLSAIALFVPIAFLTVQAEPEAADIEGEIKDIESGANAAYEANDLSKYFSFYASDFSQFLPDGRTDLAAYQKQWTSYVGDGNRVQKVEISDMHIQVGPSKDTAIASYVLHVKTKLKDGKVTEEDNQESAAPKK